MLARVAHASGSPTCGRLPGLNRFRSHPPQRSTTCWAAGRPTSPPSLPPLLAWGGDMAAPCTAVSLPAAPPSTRDTSPSGGLPSSLRRYTSPCATHTVQARWLHHSLLRQGRLSLHAGVEATSCCAAGGRALLEQPFVACCPLPPEAHHVHPALLWHGSRSAQGATPSFRRLPSRQLPGSFLPTPASAPDPAGSTRPPQSEGTGGRSCPWATRAPPTGRPCAETARAAAARRPLPALHSTLAAP